MITNKYLNELYKFKDRDFSLCALLTDLYSLDSKMLDNITNDIPNLNKCNEDEIKFLTICAAIIQYKLLELHNLKSPEWLFDNRLRFEEPYFYQKRFLDGPKENLLETNPSPFKNRNVYFELNVLTRV